MAGSVNKVILIGNLGADPEIRRTQDGRPVANLRLATSESWRDKATGERKEKTEWHRVVIFNENLCRIAEQYLKKGSKVFIEGQLQTRKWQDQSGQDRYSTEVVLQGFRGELTLLDRAGAGGPAAISDLMMRAESSGRPGRRARSWRPRAPAREALAATWTTRFRFDLYPSLTRERPSSDRRSQGRRGGPRVAWACCARKLPHAAISREMIYLSRRRWRASRRRNPEQFLVYISAEPSDFLPTSCPCSRLPRIRRPVPHSNC